MVDASSSTNDFRYRVGTGNWRYFKPSGLTIADIHAAASKWAQQLKGVEKPWLCWSVLPDWCLVQQALVREVGWTPVVGVDPRTRPPLRLKESIYIDFNEGLNLPNMWMHFPLEFVYLFCDKLAFWHSDLLLSLTKMEAMARHFETIAQGEMAAVRPTKGKMDYLRPTRQRLWEVLGLTTRDASLAQFQGGCGWWMHIEDHPSTGIEERYRKRRYHWEHGVGIAYWEKKCGGTVHGISDKYVQEGHFTRIGNKQYRPASEETYKRDLSRDLPLNYDLYEACKSLNISHLCKELIT